MCNVPRGNNWEFKFRDNNTTLSGGDFVGMFSSTRLPKDLVDKALVLFRAAPMQFLNKF